MPFDLKELLGAEKPVVAMAHLPPLPGTPLYDEVGGAAAIVESVRRDVEILTETGFDAILFCNEGDRPYQLKATFEGVAMMARVVAEIAPRDKPFGVDYLWDAEAALAVAAVSGASFIREVATGVYESDMGLWAPDAGKLLRYRRQLNAANVAVFMNITPEFASSVGTRDIATTARSVRVSSLADAILVSGPMAGAEPSVYAVREAKRGCGDETPVFANTGVKSTNVRDFLAVADGAIVGSISKSTAAPGILSILTVRADSWQRYAWREVPRVSRCGPRSMARYAGSVVHRDARRGQARGSTRAASRGASCLLLPNARLAVRGRGRRAGDVHPGMARVRAVRGPIGAAVLALPHRNQCFPGHAERERAACPADGPRPCTRARRVEPQHAAGGDLDRADPGRRPRLLTGSRPC